MRTLRYMLFGIVVPVLGCGSSGGGANDGFGGQKDDTGAKDTATNQESIAAVEVLNPRDNASDIVARDGGVFYSTQYDPAVYFWTTEMEVPEKHAWDLGDLQGITVEEGVLLASFSDSGVEGWVSRIEAPKTQVEWAAKSDDGTLFRSPKDLVFFDGDLYVVDEKVGSLWRLEGEGQNVSSAYTASGLASVAVWNDALYVSDDGGVFSVSGEMVDSRKADALGVVAGKLYGVHVERGIFEVGQPARQWAIPDLARPGPFAEYDSQVYVVDTVGGAIWRLQDFPQ